VISWKQKLLLIGKIVLVFFLFGLIMLFLMDKLVMPLYTRLGQERQVPALVGMSDAQAEVVTKKQGYRLQTSKIVFDDHLSAGTIIEQIPPAGAITKLGRIISVIVSGGEKLIPMPRLIGASSKGAQNTAASLGLVIPEDSIRYSYSGHYPRGVVAEQSIPQDSLLHKNAIVAIVVSLGPEPLEFVVPKLLGEPLSKAKRILVNSGLSLGVIRLRTTRQYPKDTVIGQSIKSETEVPKGTAIDLLISVPTQPDSAVIAVPDSQSPSTN
jgi:serine/threonine-protein kinase